MRKQTLFLCIICSLFLLSCGDDDKKSSKIKQYEKDILGIWVPIMHKDASFSLLTVNKDKTGMISKIVGVNNDVYELSDTTYIKNIYFEEVEGTYGAVHTMNSLVVRKNKEEGWLKTYVDYLDADSLSSVYSGKYKKVPSIKIK